MMAAQRASQAALEPPCGSDRVPYWYTLYGLRVRSEFRLPVPPSDVGVGAGADLHIRRATGAGEEPPRDDYAVSELRCDCAQHRGAVITRVYRGLAGTWVWSWAAGLCRIAPGARLVEVYPDPATDERQLGLVLAGPVASLVLPQRGFPCLHASAVVTSRGAAVFLGPKGQGKSTMTAAFLRRGAVLLTDDILPLRLTGDAVEALPSLPLMKLWAESATGALSLHEELPNLTPDLEKKLLVVEGRYPFAATSAPIRALYVLDRYDPVAAGHAEVSIRPLSRRESCTVLLAQTSLRELLAPADVASALPLYARLATRTPVRVLTYPHGFGHHEAVHRRILTDLEEAE